MPKRRAAGAISTGHGSFHLGDRTEVVTNANTRLTRYSRSRSAPPRDQAAPPRGRRPDRTCATALPAPQNCGAVKAGWGAESFGFVGRAAHGNSTAQHLENTYLFSKT